MVKLVYENPSIGIIIQRLGECRMRNFSLFNPRVVLSQQMPIERIFRDLVIEVDDKVVAIEFKAPELDSNSGRLVYRGIKMSTLNSIAEKFGPENVLLGLIHARLPPFALRNKKGIIASHGLYKLQLVPATTIFIQFSEFNRRESIENLGSADITITECYDYLRDIPNVNIFLPTCIYESPFIRKDLKVPFCYSCGGIYGRTRCIPHIFPFKSSSLRITVNGLFLEVCGFTLASLNMLLMSCYVGYELREVGDFNRLYRQVVELDFPLLLAFSKQFGFIPISVAGTISRY